MLNIKKIAATGAIAISGLLFSASAFAQTNSMSLSINASGEANLAGTVSVVSAPNISVSSWAGTWVVNTTGAKFSSGVNSIADIKVGDFVKVSGKVTSGMNIDARKIETRKQPTERLTVKAGLINNLNVSAGTFTLGKEAKDITVTSTSGASVFVNGVASTFSGLANNMKVIVTGILNPAQTSISANVIQAFNVNDSNFKIGDKAKENAKGNFWGHVLRLFKGKKD